MQHMLGRWAKGAAATRLLVTKRPCVVVSVLPALVSGVRQLVVAVEAVVVDIVVMVFAKAPPEVPGGARGAARG